MKPQNTYFYKELSDSERKKYFEKCDNKFLSNVDTLYYSIYFDINDDMLSNFQNMIKYLDEVKENFDCLRDEEHEIKIMDDLVYKGKSFGMYSVGFEVENKFVAFFMRRLSDTIPGVIVQLRSEYLWQNDYKYCVDESLSMIESFISLYGVTTSHVIENRIDIAYHTNYIQDVDGFFNNEMLGNNMVSHFERWSKEGIFDNDEMLCDYISLGRRKSNNVFIRIYNKVQEVINLKHKSYFLDLWLQNGLINQYDYYVYSRCYQESSYRRCNYHRLMFYYEHGKDQALKKQCFDFISNYDNVEKYKIQKFCDSILPALTLVVNFEFQLKRKFTADLKLQETENVYIPVLRRIYLIIDNLPNIHNFITNNVVRFVDRSSATRKRNCKNLAWWDMLRDCVQFNDYKLIREYEVNMNKKMIKNKMIKSVATLVAYNNYKKETAGDNTILEDVMEIIEEMNENDLDNFNSYKKKKFLQVKRYFS